MRLSSLGQTGGGHSSPQPNFPFSLFHMKKLFLRELFLMDLLHENAREESLDVLFDKI